MDDIIDWKPGWGPDLYDDGVIKFMAPKGPYRKAFRKIEKKLGINFKRTGKKEKADIVCIYKEFSGNSAGWHWRRYDFDQEREFSQIEVEPDRWYTKCVIFHEIGHALGLGHPEDHSRKDTIMSYGVSGLGRCDFFTEYDQQVLASLYPQT